VRITPNLRTSTRTIPPHRDSPKLLRHLLQRGIKLHARVLHCGMIIVALPACGFRIAPAVFVSAPKLQYAHFSGNRLSSLIYAHPYEIGLELALEAKPKFSRSVALTLPMTKPARTLRFAFAFPLLRTLQSASCPRAAGRAGCRPGATRSGCQQSGPRSRFTASQHPNRVEKNPPIQNLRPLRKLHRQIGAPPRVHTAPSTDPGLRGPCWLDMGRVLVQRSWDEARLRPLRHTAVVVR
jgi:hypothetical protein